MPGMAPYYDQGMNPAAIGGGGGLDVGAIGVFDKDPGADYVACDGAPKLLSQYPKLASTMPTQTGFAASAVAPGTFTPTSTANFRSLRCMDAKDDVVCVAAGNQIWRSTNGGQTFTVVNTGNPGYTRSHIINIPGTNNWVCIMDGSGDGGGYCVVSTDNGATWNNQAIFSASYGLTGLIWMGGSIQRLLAPNNQTGDLYSVTAALAGGGAVAMGLGSAYAGDVNPSTGTVLLVGENQVNRYPTWGTTAGMSFLSAVSNVYVFGVKYANGVWVITNGNGIYRSVNDGVSWTQMVAGNMRSLDYGNGIWIAWSDSNYSQYYIGNADASVWTLVTNPVNASTAYSTRWSGTRFILAGNGGGGAASSPILRTPGGAPSDAFVVPPSLPAATLISPKTFRMRAR